MSVDTSTVPDEVLTPLVALAAAKAKQVTDATTKTATAAALTAAKKADADSDTALAADTADVLAKAQAADQAIAAWVSPPVPGTVVAPPMDPTQPPA